MTTQKTSVRKFNKKVERTYSHVVDGKTIKTTCKVFGAVLHDDNGNFIDNCADCLQSNEIREACQIASGIKVVTFAEIMASGTGKGKGTRNSSTVKDDSLFISFVQAFKAGKSRAEIEKMMIESGLTDKAAKTLSSKLSCVTGACLRPNLKDSTIYQVARFYLLENQPSPIGDKSSIAFCTRVCKAWLADKKPVILARDI